MEIFNENTSAGAVPPDSALQTFSNWYGTCHGFLSLLVCTFGITTNVFNIAVLTRKNMRTPTNVILTGLALADCLTMMSYVPFALHFYVFFPNQNSAERNTLGWMKFVMFHANFTVTTHSVSIWLGVALSVFRFVYVRFGKSNPKLCDVSKAMFVVTIVYVYAIMLLIPNYMILGIEEVKDANNKTMYYDVSEVKRLDTLTQANFWIHAILIKIVPCVLMSIFGGLLVASIHKVQRRSKRLKNVTSQKTGAFRQRMREHSRTTRMLIVVIILFLVTEFPQGILTLLCGLKDNFFVSVYEPLGDMMDIIALINNSINFILYCSMSKTFRKTFVMLFWRFREKDLDTSDYGKFIKLKDQENTVV